MRSASTVSGDASRSEAVVHLSVPCTDDAWPALTATLRDLTGDVRVLVVWVEAARDEAPDAASSASPASATARADLLAVRQRALAGLGRADLLTVGVVADATNGVGVAVALGCDLRVFGAEASLVVDAGTAGVLGRLAELVGYARALEMSVTGRRVSAQEAGAVGLANLVVTGDDVDAAVADLVAAVLVTPREVGIEMKAALTAAVEPGARERRVAAELAAAARLASDNGSDE